ncbi:AMP-binding protein, partial [Acinetobacter baumannii]
MAAGHLSVGATLVLAARFHPAECAALIERHKVTAICFVPTMYVMLMEYDEKSPIDLSSLRICISGGAPLLWPVAERFEKRF